MLYSNKEKFLEKVKSIGHEHLKEEFLDDLVYNLALNENIETRKECYRLIREIAEKSEIHLCSIQNFYLARGRGEYKGLTVPAINLRGFTYPAARALFRAANKNKVGALILELAPSEMQYTDQPPEEYASVCLAAAIKERFKGPIFFQVDHLQVKLKKYQENPEQVIVDIKKIIKQTIEAGFYNIDIDTSTLVDLNKPTIAEQQRPNFELAAELTACIRSLEPKGVTISVGGEIGEIGGKNSTPEELRVFMDGYNKELAKYGQNLKGLSKISVQSGATHGGVVLADGSIAQVDIDFNTLQTLSKIARQEYGMAGAVQHGASTLPDQFFSKFAETETAEVHLATGFQNIIYDHPNFPKELKEKMYQWIRKSLAQERKPEWTDEQFIYKLRKKAWGPFKKEVMDLSPEIKKAISQELEKRFKFFFKELNVANTKDLVNKYIRNR